MFSKETYISRRQELKKLVKSGVIYTFETTIHHVISLIMDITLSVRTLHSSYYFGLQRDGLVGVIDIDNDIETLIGDDIDLVDIVWYGSVDSVHSSCSAGRRTQLSTYEDAQDDLQRRHVEEAQDSSCLALTATTSSCRYSHLPGHPS